MKSRKGWTRWGGSQGSSNEMITIADDWTCQSCANKQTKDQAVFMYGHNSIWLRVCSSCAGSDCEPLKQRVANTK